MIVLGLIGTQISAIAHGHMGGAVAIAQTQGDANGHPRGQSTGHCPAKISCAHALLTLKPVPDSALAGNSGGFALSLAEREPRPFLPGIDPPVPRS